MAAENKASKKSSLLIKNGKLDATFLTLVFVILTIGLVMLFSASYSYSYANMNGNSYYFIERQGLYAILGVILMLGFSYIDYHKFMNWTWIIYGGTVALLILVFFTPAINGAHRWIPLGFTNFQPSELGKFAVVLLFASLIANNYNAMKTAKFSLFFMIPLLLIPCGLVAAETHLSAAIIIALLGIILLIVGGLKIIYIITGLFGATILGIVIAIGGGAQYWQDRFSSWLDPWADATGDGYQVVQSLMSIGSGGIFGRGIGQSMQKHLWVPEPHNDFIFSIICEELGLIGAAIIIAIFVCLIWRGIIIAKNAEDKFGSMLVIGLICQVALQVMLNLMVVTNAIPNTGISLPFFSFGGTSLVFLLIEMGVILSVSRYSSVNKL